MEWWRKVTLPIRRLWFVVARRIGMRRQGLLQLRQEVKASKNKDVHVMWEMLHKSENELDDGSPTRKRRQRQRQRKRPFWSVVMGVSRMPYPSRGY